MKYFKCNRSSWFSYKNRRRDFTKEQVVKLDEVSDSTLLGILRNHPNFSEEDVQADVDGMIPKLDQLLTVPLPTRMMRREAIMQEIASFGVRPDIYAMDETLEQQLSTLRIMTKKNYVTVVDKYGKPTYVQNIKEFIEDFKNRKKEGETMYDHTNKVKNENAKNDVVDPKDYEEKIKSKDGAVVGKVEKDDDNEFDGLESFDKFVDGKAVKDKYVEPCDMKAGLSQQAEVEIENVPSEKRYPESSLKINNFRYLVNIDEKAIFASEFTEEEKETCRSVNWHRLSQETISSCLLQRGYDLKEYKESLETVFAYRTESLNKLKKIVHSELEERGDLPLIEVNAIAKRIKEISKVPPVKQTGIKVSTYQTCLSKMRRFCSNSEIVIEKKWTTRKVKRALNLLYDFSVYGIMVPRTTDGDYEKEMTQILVDKGLK